MSWGTSRSAAARCCCCSARAACRFDEDLLYNTVQVHGDADPPWATASAAVSAKASHVDDVGVTRSTINPLSARKLEENDAVLVEERRAQGEGEGEGEEGRRRRSLHSHRPQRGGSARGARRTAERWGDVSGLIRSLIQRQPPIFIIGRFGRLLSSNMPAWAAFFPRTACCTMAAISASVLPPRSASRRLTSLLSNRQTLSCPSAVSRSRRAGRAEVFAHGRDEAHAALPARHLPHLTHRARLLLLQRPQVRVLLPDARQHLLVGDEALVAPARAGEGHALDEADLSRRCAG